jgi:hypothetical protein
MLVWKIHLLPQVPMIQRKQVVNEVFKEVGEVVIIGNIFSIYRKHAFVFTPKKDENHFFKNVKLCVHF